MEPVEVREDAVLVLKHFQVTVDQDDLSSLRGSASGFDLDPSREVAASEGGVPAVGVVGWLAAGGRLPASTVSPNRIWCFCGAGFSPSVRGSTAVAFDGSAAAFSSAGLIGGLPSFARSAGVSAASVSIARPAGGFAALAPPGMLRQPRPLRRTRDLDDLLLEAFAPGADHRAVIEGRIGERGHRLVGPGGVAADLRTLLLGASGLQIVQKLLEILWRQILGNRR